MKKITALILIFTIVFTTSVHGSYTEPIYPYNNEENVTKVSKSVNGKEWRVSYRVLEGTSARIYSVDNIQDFVGKNAYIRYNKGSYYAMYKVGSKKKGYKYLIFSFEGGVVENAWFVSKIPSKKKFTKKVKKGVSLKTVKKIDPDTYNIFGNYSFGAKQYFSEHRFKDGTMALVEYKQNKRGKWIVKKVQYEQDKMNVVKTLLKKDYKLIK